MHAIAVVERSAGVGLAVTIAVAEPPEVGDAGVINVALTSQDTRTEAHGGVAEAVGEDHGRIGPAIAVAVLDKTDPVMFGAVLLELLAQILSVHGNPVSDCAAGEVVVEPVHVLAVIRDALVQAEGLSHVQPSPLVEAEGHGVSHQRLGGIELEPKPLRDPHRFQRLLRLDRCRHDRWVEGMGRLGLVPGDGVISARETRQERSGEERSVENRGSVHKRDLPDGGAGEGATGGQGVTVSSNSFQISGRRCLFAMSIDFGPDLVRSENGQLWVRGCGKIRS